MAVGDNDLGVFFADFGVPVMFNGRTVMGNFDQPNDPFAGAGGASRMESQRYTVSVPQASWAVEPVVGNTVFVAGVRYTVQGRGRSEDGKILMLELKQ